MLIVPSILNADSLNLKKSIKEVVSAGITRVHIDVMDGHFVPNLSFGPGLIRDFKREFPTITAEIHLMSNNLRLLPAFVKAGADLIEFHYEAASDVNKIDYWLDYLSSKGVSAGLVLNPDTPVSVLQKYMSKLNQVLLMTVYPGFGGQNFIPKSTHRIAETRELLIRMRINIPIEVDGGINAQTMVTAKNSGAQIFVVGSYIFKDNDINDKIQKLKREIK